MTTETQLTCDRVLACPECGAPVDVAATGGSVGCSYCGRTSVWLARRQAAAPVGAAVGKRLSADDEAERFARLRAQDADGHVPPTVVDLMAGRVLDPMKLAHAKEEWLRARAERLAGGGAGSAERLFALTRLWHEHESMRSGDARRLRSLLESTLELTATEQQATVFRAMLAADAALAGDAAQADEWLAECDPIANELAAHSAYRLARAVVATSRQRWSEVFEALGRRVGDVPMTASDEPLGAWLIANAVEHASGVVDAASELTAAIERSGPSRHVYVRAWRRARALDLCRRSRDTVREKLDWGGHDYAQLGIAVGILGAITLAAGSPFLVVGLVAPEHPAGSVGVGLVLVVLGLVVLVFGLLRARSERARDAAPANVRGTVTSIRVEPGSGESPATANLRIAVELEKTVILERTTPTEYCRLFEPGTLLSLQVNKRRSARIRIKGAETW